MSQSDRLDAALQAPKPDASQFDDMKAYAEHLEHILAAEDARTPLVRALVAALLRENAHGVPAWAMPYETASKKSVWQCGLCWSLGTTPPDAQHHAACAVLAARALVAAWPEVGGC